MRGKGRECDKVKKKNGEQQTKDGEVVPDVHQ